MATKAIKLEVTKSHPHAKLPSMATNVAAGLDLYTIEKRVKISAGQVVKLNTGLKMAIPEGYFGKIYDRSGISSKDTVIVKAGVIDPDYRGDVMVVMENTGSYPVELNVENPIAQLVIHKRETVVIQEVDSLDEGTERGEQGFGSTDK